MKTRANKKWNTFYKLKYFPIMLLKEGILRDEILEKKENFVQNKQPVIPSFHSAVILASYFLTTITLYLPTTIASQRSNGPNHMKLFASQNGGRTTS